MAEKARKADLPNARIAQLILHGSTESFHHLSRGRMYKAVTAPPYDVGGRHGTVAQWSRFCRQAGVRIPILTFY